MSFTIVRYENGKIYLDNSVFVNLINKDYCPKCKQVSKWNQLCSDCKNKKYSFNSVLTLGYYIGGWYNLSDAFTDTEYKYWPHYLLDETNPIYRFCKLINDAKKKNTVKTIEEKKEIISTLCKGLAWKIRRFDEAIIKKINFLVHVPKYDEDFNGIEPNVFNHGFYYAYYLSKELNIPFLANLIIENKNYREKNINRFDISNYPQRIQGKTIMIVDDVYTNSRTKEPIAQLLKSNGAAELYICVMGRTKR